MTLSTNSYDVGIPLMRTHTTFAPWHSEANLTKKIVIYYIINFVKNNIPERVHVTMKEKYHWKCLFQ
jgi:hypothetical protein